MHLKKLWLKTSKPKEGNIYLGTGSTEGPKQDEPKQTHTKICHNLMAKVKDRIVKAAREKQKISYKAISIFLHGNDAGQKGVS